MGTTVCDLLLHAAQMPSPEALAEAFTEAWPQLAPLPEVVLEEGAWRLDFGPMEACLELVDQPLSKLQGRAGGGSMWPTAAEDLPGHTAHLSLRLRGTSNEVQRAQLLTQLCVALLACTPALGVYWSDADLLIESSVFVELAQACEDDLPLALWVDFHLIERAEGSAGYTRGLQAFGRPELEVTQSPEPPEELYDRLYGVVAYLLVAGAVVLEGDTLGETEDEYVRARFAASSFGGSSQVLQLAYED